MESKPRRRGLEVFDFVDEEEYPDPATKFSSAYRNPSLSDSRNSKAVSVKPGSKEANAQEKKVSCMPCVDVNGADTDLCRDDISHSPPNTIEKKLATEIDFLKLDAVTQSKCLSIEQRSLDSDSCIPCLDGDAMEDDHGCDNTILHSGPESMEDKLAIKNEYLELDAATQSKCFSHEQQSDYDLNDNGCRNFLSEPERGGSNAPSPSPGKSQYDCAVNVSPSSNKLDDAVSDGDESVSESPSSPTSQIEEDDVSMDAYEFDHLGNFEVDNMNMAVVLYPDYVLYRDSYCTGDLQLTFSQSCIQISGSILSETDEALNFEFGVDDVDSVECQWYPNADCVIIKLRILSKDAARDDDALGSLGIEELKIGVFETNWSHQLEKIACLNFKYSAMLNPLSVMEEEESLEQRLHFPNFEEAFEVVYPKGNPDAVSISNRDVDLLQPDIFINDTLVDFYIKYLENQIQPEEKHRFYFFNSFFFRKLADMDKDPSSVVSDGRAAFQRVRKWTRKVDLFEKDYIFIPVNFNLHWTLLVICHPGEVPRYKDGDSGNPVKVPCILHMDSLKGSHAGIKNHVQSYLWEEWKEKKKETSEELSSKFLNLRFISLELPQQENSYDCGLFLLHYLELFLAEAPVHFNPFEIDKFSIFLNENWFLPSEASLKRTLIQRLIFELLESRYHGVPLPACSDQDQAISPGCNELETGVQCTDRHSPAVACQENISSSQADQGIEMTLLPTSSLRGSECVNDAGLVLREFFQSGETAGSLFGQYQSFEQKSPFYHPGGATHLIEEATQIGEQYTYMAGEDIVIQEITAFSSQACGIPCLSKSSGVEPSFELCNSEQGPNGKIESSHERAVCTSDCSDCIEIIEDDTVREDLGPSQKQEMDEQNYPISENATRLADELFPGIGQMPRASMIEESSKDHETVHEGNENGDPSQEEVMDVQNYPASENVNCLADELFPGLGEMQSAAVIEESSQDHETVLHGNDNGDPSQKEEMDVQKYPESENVNCLADELVSGLGEMQSTAMIEESSQYHEMVHDGNDNGDPSQKEVMDVQNYPASENVNCLADELFPGLGEMQSAAVIEESSQDQETVFHGNDNGDPSQKEEMDVQKYPASENVNCLADELVSGPGEMQSAAVIEENSPDHGAVHDDNENGDSSQKEEMDLQNYRPSENVTCLADKLGSGLVEMQSATMIEESLQDHGMVHDGNENGDSSQKEEMDLQKHPPSENVTCLADELVSGLAEMQSAAMIEESSQYHEMVYDGNDNGDPSQKEEMDVQNYAASENVNCLADELVSGLGEMQSVAVIEETSQDNETGNDGNENGDSSQEEKMDLQKLPASENVTCLADELGCDLVEMQSAAVIEESSQDLGTVHDDNENEDSSQKELIDLQNYRASEIVTCIADKLGSGLVEMQSTTMIEESSQDNETGHDGNENGDSSQKEEMDLQKHPPSENVTCLVDELGSVVVEMQSAAVIEESSQDHGTVHDDNENGDSSQKEEMHLQNYRASENVNSLADEHVSGPGEMQSAAVIEESSPDHGAVHDDNENGDSSQKEEMDLQNYRPSENVTGLADKLGSGLVEMQSAIMIEESLQDHGMVHDGNENGDSSQKEEMDLQKHPPSENVTCLADELGSVLVEMQSAAVIEENSQDHEMVHDDNENGDSSQTEEMDLQKHPPSENVTCLADELGSGLGEMQSSSVIEENSQDHGMVHDDNENRDSSQKEEMDLQNYRASENVTCVADKLGSGSVEMQSATMIEESSQDHGMVHDGNENGDSSQKKEIDETIDLSTENAVCLAIGLVSGSGKVQSTCVIEESSQHKRKLHDGNEIGGSVASSQENSGIPHQDSVTVGNGTIPSDDMQMFDNGLLPEAQDPESEEQRAAKRMRITPPIEVEKCVTGNLPEDAN